MNDNLEKKKSLIDQLVAATQPITESDMVLYIHTSLSPEYDHLVVLITTRVEPISLDDLDKRFLTDDIDQLNSHK